MSATNIIILILSCGIALVVDILLMLDSNSVFMGNTVKIKKMQKIILVGIIQTVVYLADYILHEFNFFELKSLGMLVESLVYIANILYIAVFADFVFAKYKSRFTKIKINRILFLFPLGVLIILAVINIFVPIYFDISAEGFNYVEKPMSNFVNAFAVFYVLVAGVNDLIELKRNSRYDRMLISLCFLLALVGLAIEGIYSDFPIVPIACAISMTIMHLRLLKQVGYIDTLSGLFMKSCLPAYLDKQVSKSSQKTKIAGIMIDINKFKHINDTYGHVVGDRAIKSFGNILKDVVGKKGLCFRYGGDEFVVIFKVTSTAEITGLIDHLNKAVFEFNSSTDEPYELSLSLGATVYDVKSDTELSFMDRMDAEMYKDKRAKR